MTRGALVEAATWMGLVFLATNRATTVLFGGTWNGLPRAGRREREAYEFTWR